jgi:hypothetical protein
MDEDRARVRRAVFALIGGVMVAAAILLMAICGT